MRNIFVKASSILFVIYLAFGPEVEATNPGTENDVFQITIKAVVGQLKFDITEFSVKPNQSVELTFENPDFMPHNLLIVAPGTADEINRLSMSAGFDNDYIPDSPNVLFTTRLLNNQEVEILEFTAPSEPGEYPYICTFPGHGELMRGIMKVEE
ncbi:MAG: hypothetical protein JJU13_20450 [Balneolaceae bacterium]|nr:hypothetical protein [Balneolaceae bacterium]